MQIASQESTKRRYCLLKGKSREEDRNPYRGSLEKKTEKLATKAAAPLPREKQSRKSSGKR